MKKFLPKTKYTPQGFTLIELLVVVAIIAILSVIGLAVFGGVQKSARDARRKADIDAISKAYEVTYDIQANGSSTPYRPLVANDFQGGAVPTPPEGGNYIGIPLLNKADTYKVCATLEGGTAAGCSATTATCYCKSAAQSSGIATAPVCTTLDSGSSTACRINNARTPSTGPIYIDCPSSPLNCNGSTANLGTFTYYSQQNGGTAGDNTGTTISIFGDNASNPSGVTLRNATIGTHQP